MTRVDDLQVGMFVAVAEYRGEREQPVESMFGMFGFDLQRVFEPKFDGKPWRIAAISLPFVALYDGQQTQTVDTRLWGLQRVTRQYAQAVERERIITRDGEHVVVKGQVFGRKRTKKQKPDKRACPRCGQRMIERLKVPGQAIWAVTCKRCGYEGPAAPELKP